jgi:hypothetical protein
MARLLTLDVPDKAAYDNASFGEKAAAYFHQVAVASLLSDEVSGLEEEIALRKERQHEEADRVSRDRPNSYQIFLNTQTIPGYCEAEQSWIEAWSIFWSCHGFRKVVSPRRNVLEVARQFFVVQCKSNPVIALKDNAGLVHDAAKRGDLDFFVEVAKAVLRSKPGKKRAVNVKEISMWNVLSRWLHGCLWLMSADRGSIALGAMTGVLITESNYTKVCQRLGLLSWKSAHNKPIINGYSPRTKRFLFAEGGHT